MRYIYGRRLCTDAIFMCACSSRNVHGTLCWGTAVQPFPCPYLCWWLSGPLCVPAAANMFMERHAGVQLYRPFYILTCIDGFPVLNIFLQHLTCSVNTVLGYSCTDFPVSLPALMAFWSSTCSCSSLSALAMRSCTCMLADCALRVYSLRIAATPH